MATEFEFEQRIVPPSEMSPATRRQFIAAGDTIVIEWCRKHRPSEILHCGSPLHCRSGEECDNTCEGHRSRGMLEENPCKRQ